jgi:hypothetical protein
MVCDYLYTFAFFSIISAGYLVLYENGFASSIMRETTHKTRTISNCALLIFKSPFLCALFECSVSRYWSNGMKGKLRRRKRTLL